MEFNKVLFTNSGWRVIRKHKQFAARWRRSIQNWPIQSAGADLLRLVCCLCTEAGIRVVAPVHDALVVEDSTDRIVKTVGDTREIMRQASVDMFGCPIRTEAEIFCDRFVDQRGVHMWNRITQMMVEEPYPRSPQIELFEGVRTGA